MKSRRAPPFRTNPSAIARYFFHDCERFFYYSSATPEQRKKEGLPTPEFDHSPLVESILDSGHRWETEVVEQLLKGRAVVAGGPGELHTRRLPLAQTLECLRREPPGRYLYQATLSPPKRFYETYGLDPGVVVLSDNHPDLIEVLPDAGGGRLLRVVDVKRGAGLRLTHRVQILFYALELQASLEAEGITTARADLEHGGVWLGRQPQPEVFGLGDFRPHLEKFLRDDLMNVLESGAAEAAWHLYPRCEWCEYFDHCRAEMRRKNDVSRLVQLTTYGKRHLREEAGVQTLTELGHFLKRADADEVLGRCASLAGQRHRLEARVAALEQSEPQLHGACSTSLPQGENVGLFLTLQQEPLGKTIYLAGLHVTARAEVRQAIFSPEASRALLGPDGKPQPALWVAARPEEAPAIRRALVLLLHDLLEQVHRYNARHTDWQDQLSLQAYTHTEDERALLFACLLDTLQDPSLSEKAMTLLFHFQGPELMHAERHPGSEVAYPVVVLLNAVSQLLALPVEVSYTLPEILAALRSPFQYTRRDYYHFPLGHGLRAEALHAAWYRGKTENLNEIAAQARLYLLALAALLRAVRERASRHLFSWPPKFSLPKGAGIKDRTLSRLAFFTRYESLLRCLAVREGRAESRPTQVLLGRAIELQAVDAARMRVAGDLVVTPEADGFPSWLLVHDSDEGRRAQVEYADYWYRNKVYGGPDSPHRAVVGLQDVSTTPGGDVVLTLSYVRGFKGTEPRRGDRFLLAPRFTDFTVDPVVQFLEELDRDRRGRLFLDLLHNPEQTAAPLPLPKKVEALAAAGAAALNLTPSQGDAYRAICSQRVTAVWGPPGTGKTHFLASTVVGLASAHGRAGKPFRVLVTAFTHAAIENLLRKIEQRQREVSGAGADLRLAKAKYWQGAAAAVEVVSEDEAADWLGTADRAVLGATAFTCLKKRDELEPFDLVVIDEASQVRVPDAAIAVSLVAPGGRLVLAGDHCQLPPIVAGSYPENKDGGPPLHRSLFEVVAGGAGTLPAGRVIRQLLENFRMNDVLTSFAAQLLYGPDYRCVNAAVAKRRLAWKAGRGIDPIVKACLDPNVPLVVVVLDGIRASQANPVEADLVAQLVTALRGGLLAENGKLYADDATFFRHGVFVVSPHHAQIRAIQRELAKTRSWATLPFVDTVDKMQGQEAEAVVISYGVSDPEFAMKEAAFIYGLNRLNVSITRGRSKTVLCLPRPLLEATPQVLDVPAAASGLAFMRRLVALVEQSGEVLTFEGDEVEARVLRAEQPPRRCDVCVP